ncbi:hypothetical protein PFICI_07930 [Pestalotiopsis fici W106-1]|uniref:NACHT domain-containing protein n=1 Tax=Pestalotiopsis fici (strain W106-1 / CGMCC3.15140) TaxID=1229662 RepID=W3X5D5_PESFW|nr:uncharacterized protein PFICI_07930 [Pestalotiopsis fici W106-1]ETS80401.1 hypothetical protein PFICI_07930 [Pestalotiopsis fici W106-1]
MRLLQSTPHGFKLTKDFLQDDIPSYAILSHTWGPDDDEVTYRDLCDQTGVNKPGHWKLQVCSNQASRDGLEYSWIDTCCIDKSSSAELTEALNSMFRWYQNAAKCYVLLSDVLSPFPGPPAELPSAFWTSRWFSLGWTLQELLAPRHVDFFSAEGQWLGNKTSLRQSIHEITGIPLAALRGLALSEFTVDERRLWAANRTTKREEDMAYCLLGIFDVFLPPIYGEGMQHALERLEEAIQKRCSGTNKKRPSASFQSTATRQRMDTMEVNQDTLPGHNLFLSSSEQEAADQSQEQEETAKTGQGDIQVRTSVTDPATGHVHAMLLEAAGSTKNLENIAKTRQRLLDMLRFPEIDDRLINLKEATGGTCQWFLLKPEYVSWQSSQDLTQHNRFLWIKGKPGTGKSILMKFLYFDVKRQQTATPDSLVIPFFFNARGSELERSVVGCYRSLLVELCVKFPGTLDVLDQLGSNAVTTVVRNGWQLEPLKKVFKSIIARLKDMPIFLFIDALDECAGMK